MPPTGPNPFLSLLPSGAAPLAVLRPPSWMPAALILGLTLWQWLLLAGLFIAAFVAGTVLQWLILAIARPVIRRTASDWDDKIVDTLPGPTRVLIGLVLARLWLPLLGLPEYAEANVGLLIRVLLIIAGTWLVLRAITLVSEVVERLMARGVREESLLRGIHTRVAVPRGIVRFLTILVGVALVLLQFEVVRTVGVSLIASAGLAGIVLGLAAQGTLANLLAGIQIAFTQPIKIGDTVVVEGEFGTVEEIGFTYVVVRTWDQRRLILPVRYFLEKPIQNWTVKTSDLLGTVYLYADYTVSVDAARAEVKRVVESSDLWDGRAQGLQVTNLTERTVELRALVSAKDASALWDLRCHLRERLLAWLQSQGAGAMPLTRVELDRQPADGSPS